MRCNPNTVDLLYRSLTSPQSDAWEAIDPGTWVRDGRPLSPAQADQVRRANALDWDALDLLLSMDAYMLNIRRDEVLDRLRAAGLPACLPPVA